MAKFERVSPGSLDWGKTLGAFPDANVFQSPAWLAFLAETQKAEPVHAALRDGGDTLGYFTGLIVKKFGVKILGSPFRGWSTPYMGFNLRGGVPRRAAVAALKDFAFRELRCIHFEVVDPDATVEDVNGLGLEHEPRATMEINLTQSEDELLANMTKTCRWTVRKAEKNGVIIEEASDLGFADEYSAQLNEVFAKQDLVPHFGVERVRALIRHVHPTGMLLMLRARDPGGRCIATGLYPGYNRAAFFWGGASWREHQKLYPNELLQWHAMKYWKSRGLQVYNLVGTMEFKQKFGGRQTAVPMIVKSRNRLVSKLRSSAPKYAKAALHAVWRVKNFAKGKRTGCLL
jgi:Acetyltransferase (GNAT) domain